MSSLDQYETEPSAFYSGSYTGYVVFGDVGAEGFTEGGNQRAIAASKLGGDRGEAYFSQAFAPYYLVDGYTSGSFAGRPQRFNRIQSEAEQYYDSFVPNPIEIHLTNTEDITWYEGSLTASGSARWGILAHAGSTEVSGGGGLMPVWATEPNATSYLPRSAVDEEWWVKFPFESKYKEVERLFRFQGVLPTTYTATRGWSDGALLTPASSSNLLSGITAGFNGGFAIVVALGYFRKPGEQYPWRGTTGATHVGTVPPRVYLEFYYGIGDGAVLPAIYERGPGYLSFPTIPIFVRRALLRGYRYGLYSATPTNTTCVFRHSRFGQVRDMLEQRRYTKFLDTTRGQTTTTSPVEVRFVSGTQAFARSVDYVTATNPDYNVRDSGIYDLEYKAGQPFFEV